MLNTSVQQDLRAKAHHLKPVVMLGANGLTPAVVNETDVALIAHELIKVKINGALKDERRAMAEDLCQQLQAELVQLIGNTAIIFRKNKEAS